jgi:hypothetical protein
VPESTPGQRHRGRGRKTIHSEEEIEMPQLAETAWKYRHFIWKHRRGLWRIYEHRTGLLAATGMVLGFVAADTAGRIAGKRL